ncbi:MAG: DUF3267 domain-containing protein [Flavobacteriales bacterium]|nr:DUF3267 domain-containing protein [Flavobacteriales bacterium]
MQGVVKKDLTISLTKVNFLGMAIMIPIYLMMTTVFGYLWDADMLFKYPHGLFDYYKPINGYLVAAIVLGSIVVHELIHGLTWAYLTGKGMKAIKFGVKWSMLTPYCHCTEPMLIKHYKIGGLMPGVVLGVIPFTISLITGDISTFFFSLFNTTGAVGDFMMLYVMRGQKNTDYAQDSSEIIGCYVYTSEKE